MINQTPADAIAKALRNLVIFHSPDHPEHDTLFENWNDDCVGNDTSPTTAGLLDSLIRQARRALGEQAA